jgi:hypothetical protein
MINGGDPAFVMEFVHADASLERMGTVSASRAFILSVLGTQRIIGAFHFITRE